MDFKKPIGHISHSDGFCSTLFFNGCNLSFPCEHLLKTAAPVVVAAAVKTAPAVAAGIAGAPVLVVAGAVGGVAALGAGVAWGAKTYFYQQQQDFDLRARELRAQEKLAKLEAEKIEQEKASQDLIAKLVAEDQKKEKAALDLLNGLSRVQLKMLAMVEGMENNPSTYFRDRYQQICELEGEVFSAPLFGASEFSSPPCPDSGVNNNK